MASLIDTSNFDKFDEIDAWHPAMLKTRGENDSQFIGFTFKRNQENERSVLVKALENLEKNKNSNSYRCLNSNNQSVQQKYDSQFNDKIVECIPIPVPQPQRSARKRETENAISSMVHQQMDYLFVLT